MGVSITTVTGGVTAVAKELAKINTRIEYFTETPLPRLTKPYTRALGGFGCPRSRIPHFLHDGPLAA